MKDKSLSMMLMVLFGISGALILAFTWLQPMPGMERILGTVFGAVGLGVALRRIPLLKSPKVAVEAEKVPAEIKD